MDRKKQIVDEAMRLFSQSGYDGVTIKQLAKACGISEPALYRHYASKEAIYDAVLDSIKLFMSYDGLFEKLDKEPEVRTLFTELASHILGFLNTHHQLYRLLLYSALHDHSKARKIFRELRVPYVKFLMGQLNKKFSEGKIKKKNNEITARCFVGMVFECALGASLWKGFQGKRFKPEEVIANNVPIFIDGLMVDGSDSRKD
ncbi:MAG: TetR/AcrR family transcriptional regulator [FCB group bacterium]|nr:TetR/AcrR family transcriptional regulator [FCB group bacterium]